MGLPNFDETLVGSADLIDLFPVILLFVWMWSSKTCAGVSAKWQMTLTLAAAARCIYFFCVSQSYGIVSLISLCLSCNILFCIYRMFRKTYDQNLDRFRMEYVIALAALLAFGVTWRNYFFENCGLFSIYLEAVAMWPQFYMIYKSGQVTTPIFVCFLSTGINRSLYVGHWMIQGRSDLVSGSIQVLPIFALWILCLRKVVTVVHKTSSDWFVYNLTQQSEGVFVIGKAKSGDERSDRCCLIDPTNEKKDKGVVEVVPVHGSGQNL